MDKPPTAAYTSRITPGTVGGTVTRLGRSATSNIVQLLPTLLRNTRHIFRVYTLGPVPPADNGGIVRGLLGRVALRVLPGEQSLRRLVELRKLPTTQGRNGLGGNVDSLG